MVVYLYKKSQLSFEGVVECVVLKNIEAEASEPEANFLNNVNFFVESILVRFRANVNNFDIAKFDVNLGRHIEANRRNNLRNHENNK